MIEDNNEDEGKQEYIEIDSDDDENEDEGSSSDYVESIPALARASPIVAKNYPLDIYILQRKEKAFSKHYWKDIAPMERLKLFQDLLHGLLNQQPGR